MMTGYCGKESYTDEAVIVARKPTQMKLLWKLLQPCRLSLLLRRFFDNTMPYAAGAL